MYLTFKDLKKEHAAALKEMKNEKFIKNSAAKKSTKITARKNLNEYKTMKRPKKHI